MNYILYILSVAIITMLLIYLGIIKEKGLPVELAKKLYAKCEKKVMKHLEKNSSITIPEIRQLIQNETASVIWSRKRLGVTDPKNFVKTLVNHLLAEDKIERIDGKVNSFKIKK